MTDERTQSGLPTNPWPIFGVMSDANPPAKVCVYDDDHDTSLCGYPLRWCATPAETELPTCSVCATEARRHA